MSNTGTKIVLTLRKYINGQATSETKPNSPTDPDYIAPYVDTTSCPINQPAPTTTTTTGVPTTTTTTLAPGETTTTTLAPCYTYIVQNRNQSQGPNISYTYVDCNGVFQGPFIVPADSDSRDFCAEPDSIVVSGSGGGYEQLSSICEVSDITTTTTTGIPTTTTTTVAPPCRLYSVENYHLTANMYIMWKDCNGVNQGPVTIPPDTFYPEDICAQEGSITYQGSNTSGNIQQISSTCS